MKQPLQIVSFLVILLLVAVTSGCVFKKSAIKEDSSTTYLEPAPRNNSGKISLGHSKYQFEIEYPTYFIEGEMTQTILASLLFPESYTTGTNLSEAYIFVNRIGRTCEELGYGFETKPEWRGGKKVLLNERFKEKVFVGDVEFNRMFCASSGDGYNLDTLVYMTERMNQPLGLALVLISQNLADTRDASLYDPTIFEDEYIQVLETYINKNGNIE